MSHIKVERHSKDYHCAVRAGWRFSNGQVVGRDDFKLAKFNIKCVCGRREVLTIASPSFDKLDVAKLMREEGAISEAHLLDDGYTQDQINDLLKPYKEAGLMHSLEVV